MLECSFRGILVIVTVMTKDYSKGYNRIVIKLNEMTGEENESERAIVNFESVCAWEKH